MSIELGRILIVDETKLAGGGYSNGDLIVVSYDQDNNVYVVTLNGATITSGNPILPFEGFAAVSVTNNNVSFCDSTTLIEFFGPGGDFPYFRRESTANSPTCTADIVCDIAKEGQPIIKSATSTSPYNGEVTVVASSTQAIEFSTSPFNYGSGTAGTIIATDGDRNFYRYTATGLVSGSNVIYAADANNCKVSFFALVGFNNAYAERYHMSFRDHKGNDKFKVSIEQRGFTGSTTELDNLGASPVMIDYARSDTNDKLNTLYGASCIVNLVSDATQEWGDVFNSIAEREYLIKIYFDPDSTNELLWQGFVIPEIYTEPYEAFPFESSVQATDGLRDLQNIDYKDNGQAIVGNSSVLDVVVFCLEQTGLQQDIRIAYNLYEASMDSGATDDPLAQLYSEQRSNINDENTLSCYDVLERYMKALRASLYSWGGYWYIVRDEELPASYDFRQFSELGAYQSNGTFDPVVEIKTTGSTNRLRPVQGANRLEFETVYRNIEVVSERQLRVSISNDFVEGNLNGNGFLGWTPFLNGESGSWSSVNQVRNGYAVNEDGSRQLVFLNEYAYRGRFQVGGNGQSYIQNITDIEYSAADSFIFDLSYIYEQTAIRAFKQNKIRYEIKVNNKWWNAIDDTWSTTQTVNEFIVEEPNIIQTQTVTGRFDQTVTTPTPSILQIRLYSIDAAYADIEATDTTDLTTQMKAIDTTNLPIGTIITARIEESTKYKMYYYELRDDTSDVALWIVIEPTDNSDLRWVIKEGTEVGKTTRDSDAAISYLNCSFVSLPSGQPINETQQISKNLATSNKRVLNYPIQFFDLDTSVNNSKQLVVNYWRKSNGRPTVSWGPDNKKLQEIILDYLASQFKTAKKRLQLTLYSEDVIFTPRNVLKIGFDNNRVFRWTFLNIDLKNRTYSGEFSELTSDTEITLFEHTRTEHSNAEHS